MSAPGFTALSHTGDIEGWEVAEKMAKRKYYSICFNCFESRFFFKSALEAALLEEVPTQQTNVAQLSLKTLYTCPCPLVSVQCTQ